MHDSLRSVEGTRVHSKIPIRIKLEALNARAIDLFECSIPNYPMIVECYAITGHSDYLLFISVDDIQEFEEIHRNILSKLPGVKKIKAYFPLRRVVQVRKM